MSLGYTGKPYDALTGLYNYGYRDYQPQMARFTTVDPIRDGSNWFAYVNNDPVNWVDPLGLQQCISASDSNSSIKFIPGTGVNAMDVAKAEQMGSNIANSDTIAGGRWRALE
jgi:RHS repeat-associated protein